MIIKSRAAQPPDPPPTGPILPPPERVEQAGILLAIMVMGSLPAELGAELARLEAQHGEVLQRLAMAWALDFLAQHKPVPPERQVRILQGRRP